MGKKHASQYANFGWLQIIHVSDNTFQIINNLLINIKLNNNFNKGAYP